MAIIFIRPLFNYIHRLFASKFHVRRKNQHIATRPPFPGWDLFIVLLKFVVDFKQHGIWEFASVSEAEFEAP